MTESPSPRKALVVGATGIVGQTLSAQLASRGWQVTGLSRSKKLDIPGVVSIQADLQDPEALKAALMGVDAELVAITAWTRMDTEEENIRVNGGAVRNLLNALDPEPVRHVALMTGLKHYLGPFDNYATGLLPDTPFREEEPRLDKPNFYYAQEDELFAGSQRMDATWSVHRSHTIFGFATGNAMNMVLTLSAYATICREQGMPFIFPGSETQWNGVTDVTDADLLGEQIIWAADTESAHNQAFNIANGDAFRWRSLWPKIAAHFGVKWEGFSGEPRPLAIQMADAAPIWRELASEYNLVEPDVRRIASWWHSDSDLGRNIECLTDMNKSRKAGFLQFRDSADCFFEYVERYKQANIIP